MKKSASLVALVVALPVSFAAAADLPSRKEPAIAPIVVPSWTGFHVGLNAGGTWGAGGATNMSTWTA
jgi:outer membrane immunogenic protein